MPTKILKYDLNGPPPSLQGLEDIPRLRLHLFSGGRAIGKLTLHKGHHPMSQRVLVAEVAQYCLANILKSVINLSPEQLTEWLLEGQLAEQHLTGLLDAAPSVDAAPPVDDFQTTLSIVIPTRDRPEDLARCLTALLQLKSKHLVEIVVSDNNPGSGLSEPVARRFPVKYVSEPRAGASYARNAGVAASSGDIIVFTDDDTEVAPDWLAQLVAPFCEPDVMCVTGLVLPLELETHAQELFEIYGAGGLERGFIRRKLGREFFEMWHGAVQTWQLGGTANCAIRAEVFTRSEMGPFDETLGPGTSAGVGEDTYMFYRILKAGYSCVYEPAALVYHCHRRDMKGLRRQLFSYSKGAVSQQIRILLTDKDKRALVQLLRILPKWHYWRIFERLVNGAPYPAHLVLMEIWGNLLGVPGFFQAVRLVQQQGRITSAQIAAARQKEKEVTQMNTEECV